MNAKDREGNTLFYDPTQKCGEATVQLLLENGADINAVIPTGGTVLTDVLLDGNEKNQERISLKEMAPLRR